jgi:hypothetical protein
MTDLSLATTPELVAELFGRYDHAMFAGMAILTTDAANNGRMLVQRRWKGNTHTVVGLAHDACNEALRVWHVENRLPAEDHTDDHP